MGTKVEVIEGREKTNTDFPKLMQSTSGRLVWMLNPDGEGMALSWDSDIEGRIFTFTVWNLDNFSDFHGSVTLSNTKD